MIFVLLKVPEPLVVQEMVPFAVVEARLKAVPAHVAPPAGVVMVAVGAERTAKTYVATAAGVQTGVVLLVTVNVSVTVPAVASAALGV